MNITYIIIGTVVSIVLVATIIYFKKEHFTDPPVIHPILIDQAPSSVQQSNTDMNNLVQIFVSNIGKQDAIVTNTLVVLSQLEEAYGIPAGDFYTGNYTGLWTCNNNGSTAVWTFNKVPGVVATTFPTSNQVVVPLPEDMTNTYWSCRPNHAVGVPTLLRLNLSPVGMSVWNGVTWN